MRYIQYKNVEEKSRSINIHVIKGIKNREEVIWRNNGWECLHILKSSISDRKFPRVLNSMGVEIKTNKKERNKQVIILE